MSLPTRALLVLSLSGTMVWGGYQASVLRARSPVPHGDIIAAAGAGEPSLFSGSESQPESDSYRISALSIFSNVAIHVKDNYVDPARIDPKDMLRSSLAEIERQVAEVLVEDLDDGRVKVSVPGHSKTVVIKDVESLWEINIKLRDLFRFFEKHLPPQKDMRAVEYAAVNGALSTLDPHSILLEPKAFDDMKTSTKGEFGGLGIVISVRDAKLTIISPLEGTPASRAGLKAMDVISRIGEVSTVSMAIDEAVRLLRGREGSKVTIWVQRKGWPEARKFTLTRELIKIESISSKLLAGDIGYVRIKNFQQNTGRDLEEHVQKLEKEGKQKLTGLVLDLRNNPGGLLEQAIRVSDKFLSSGDIVTTVGYGNKLREPKRAQWGSSDLDIPVVVLVNNGSASASEIVAGALKNLDRALIVGERTFGKGSVQVLYDFADSSALKLTIAQYLTPGGISIQNIGVTPDVELKPARIEERGVQLFYEPDHHREGNLKKHLERQTPEEPPSEVAAERITYLEETKTEAAEAAEEDDGAEEEQGSTDDFREDFPIRLARRVLTESGRNKRAEMLSASRAILRQVRDEEEQKITKSLSELGLDWSQGDEGVSMVSADLRFKGRSDARVLAGETVELEARVTNGGTRTLYRVRGQLETEHPSFRAREFFFGKLAPGESRSWAVKVKIPKESDARSDVVNLKLASSRGAMDTHVDFAFATRAVPHPLFAYSYSFDDRERGDGDGVLERGEGVDFVIHVTNTGAGSAEKINLRLKSAAGEDLFLERGRGEIENLAAGATKPVRMRFRVREELERSRLPLQLTIYDGSTGEWLEDEIQLSAADPTPVTKLSKRKGSGAVTTDVRLLREPVADSPVLATLPKGAAVRYDATLEGFLRVELENGGFAFLPAEAVKSRVLSKNAPVLAGINHIPARRPPIIELDGEIGGRVIESDELVFSGRIYGRAIRDMYVTLNDQKVMYAPGPAVTALETPSPIPNDKAVELPFERRLKLENGLNKLIVVARLDDRLVTYRHVFVSKRKGSATRVAEAASEQPKPKSAN